MAEQDERRGAAYAPEYRVVVETLGIFPAAKPFVQRHDERADSGFDPGAERSRLVAVPHRNATDVESASPDVFVPEQALEYWNGVRVVVADDESRLAGENRAEEALESRRGFQVCAFPWVEPDGLRQVAEHEDAVLGHCLDEREEILGGVVRPPEWSWNEMRVGKA